MKKSVFRFQKTESIYMRIGFHVSIASSVDKAVDRAEELGINTFQIFTRNPRCWQSKPLDSEEIKLFKEKLGRVDIKPVLAHMPYLPNLASPRREVYTLSVKALITELSRCNILGVKFLVMHLGSHLGSGKAKGSKRIVEAINRAFTEVEGKTMLLLENTSGTKNSMGSSFEDIKQIAESLFSNERIGMCLDTCHAFAAGYDLRGKQAVEETLTTFDSVLGLKRLKAVHLNDSVGTLGSCLDRHEHIGLGRIGEEGFKAILDSELRLYPIIMETPIDGRRRDFENLMKVKAMVG